MPFVFVKVERNEKELEEIQILNGYVSVSLFFCLRIRITN
jgi:hypothetical protein